MSKADRKRGSVQVVDMNGSRDFTYTRSFDSHRPAAPKASDFSAKIPVLGYWDEQSPPPQLRSISAAPA